MRRCFITLATLVSVGIAGSASADGAFTDYLDNTRAHFLTGLNSLVTTPADPVMGLAEPPEEYQSLPGSVVTSRFFGAIQGSIMAVYRGSMGVLDMALSPLPITILSPEPRYQPIPGFEWDQ